MGAVVALAAAKRVSTVGGSSDMFGIKTPKQRGPSAASGPVHVPPPVQGPSYRVKLGKGRESEPEFRGRSRPRRPFLSGLAIILAGVGLFVICGREDYLIGQIAAPMLTLGALHGLWRGGFYKVVMLSLMVGLFWLAAGHPYIADPVVTTFGGTAGSFTSGLVTMVAVGTVLLVGGFVTSSIRRRLIVRRRFLLAFDRLIGTTVGVAEGALGVLSICWATTLILPSAQMVLNHKDTVPGSVQSQVAQTVVRLGDEARRGALGEAASAYNPIEDIPGLTEAIEEFNTTGRLNLQGLDPAMIKQVNALLESMPGETAEGEPTTIGRFRDGNAARGEAYKQLPAPEHGGR